MPQIGPAEILVIVLVGLLVFGPTRLPEIGRQVGRGMREVKKLQTVLKDELDSVLHADAESHEADTDADTSTDVRTETRVG
jgi:Tat protein translocase TatB subunit